MTEWVFTPDKVRETFAGSQTVTISNTSTPVDVSATLNRVVARFEIFTTDQQTMTLTLDALDADGNSVSHKVVPNVPFQRNKLTRLTGALYSADVTGNFTVNTAWISDTNFVDF